MSSTEKTTCLDVPFVPVRKQKPVCKHIGLAVEVGTYEEIKAAAKRHGLSIDDFSLQAIRFALEHLEQAQ